MGLINAFNSVGKMNDLLKEAEYQLKIVCDMQDSGADRYRMLQELNQLKILYNQISEVLDNSAGARVATYSFMGERGARSWQILAFLQHAINELS